MAITQLFANKAQRKSWLRIDDAQITGARTGIPIAADEAYVVVRMSEMYLRHTRKLWRKFYPVLHGFTDHRGQESHSVAGPGELQEISDANLDRIMNFNFRLAGPIAYQGGDLDLLVGLYSVPGGDAAKALVETVSAIAGLANLGVSSAIEIGKAVKSGIESVLALDESRLELGVRDSFYHNNPLQSGFHLGIDAPEAKIDLSKLWLRDGRLVKGEDADSAEPFSDHDYVVVEIERRESRSDWRGFPEFAQHETEIREVMTDHDLDVEQKKDKLRKIWREFREAINASDKLITPDKRQIAASVARDIRDRLEEEPLFEGVARGEPVGRVATGFDFLEVREVLDPADGDATALATELLADRDPF